LGSRGENGNRKSEKIKGLFRRNGGSSSQIREISQREVAYRKKKICSTINLEAHSSYQRTGVENPIPTRALLNACAMKQLLMP